MKHDPEFENYEISDDVKLSGKKSFISAFIFGAFVGSLVGIFLKTKEEMAKSKVQQQADDLKSQAREVKAQIKEQSAHIKQEAKDKADAIVAQVKEVKAQHIDKVETEVVPEAPAEADQVTEAVQSEPETRAPKVAPVVTEPASAKVETTKSAATQPAQPKQDVMHPQPAARRVAQVHETVTFENGIIVHHLAEGQTVPENTSTAKAQSERAKKTESKISKKTFEK